MYKQLIDLPIGYSLKNSIRHTDGVYVFPLVATDTQARQSLLKMTGMTFIDDIPNTELESEMDKYWVNQIRASVTSEIGGNMMANLMLANKTLLNLGLKVLYTVKDHDGLPIAALKSLLDMPMRFSELKPRNIGFVVFTSKQRLSDAVRMNVGQYMAVWNVDEFAT